MRFRLLLVSCVSAQNDNALLISGIQHSPSVINLTSSSHFCWWQKCDLVISHQIQSLQWFLIYCRELSLPSPGELHHLSCWYNLAFVSFICITYKTEIIIVHAAHLVVGSIKRNNIGKELSTVLGTWWYLNTSDSCSKPLGLPWWLSRWRICLQCRRHRRCRLDPWVRKIPWRRKWQEYSSILA